LLALLILFFSFTNVATYIFTRKKNYQLMVEDLEIQAKSHGELVQMLEGMQTLKCSGVEHRAVQNWSTYYVDEINLSLKRGTLGAWIDAVQTLITAAAPLTLLAVGASLVVKGNLTLGTMMAVSSLAGGVFGPVSSLVDSALQLQLLGGYLDRIEDVMETKPEQERGGVSAPQQLTGRVSAEALTFRYNASGDPVINNVSLNIRAGSSVAIVGMSGSGKSTLANLLVGLYQPQEGAVYFDGEPLRNIDMQAVRRQIGIVPQHPFIFSGSIRENISLTAPGASMEEVVRAAQIACIHDDIMQMPMGYETLVSGGGTSLSGGQRQRIAIARAVIRHSPLVLLDEATSALDAVTEERVIRNLKHLGCTRVIIAHRLSTIADADVIVVLHQGKIVEMGTHQELLARGGGYWQLVKLQSSQKKELIA
jgi:ABC-type bacteriocin/lantibiotic exporter with double-glycine peptidase domain